MDCSVDGIPNSLQLALQIIFFMIVEDFLFHPFHRIMHWPRLYPHIHKLHHEHKITIAIGTFYFHPVEFCLFNIPSFAGPMILGKNCHITTSLAWYALRVIEGIESHSGYEFSWSPFRIFPFAVDYAYHAYHHS